MPEQQNVTLVSVGNTRTRFAVGALDAGAGELRGEAIGGATPGQLEPSRVLENDDLDTLATAIADESDKGDASVILIASVNDPIAQELSRRLEMHGQFTIRRFGAAFPIPIANTLTDDSTVGQDRLLNALGAFARSRQACIVIDAGTAVTVDFVDGVGVFQGGAIAPGIRMMRDALHERTAALPKVELMPQHLHQHPDAPFGKDTVEAMNLGVTSSVIGLVHHLIDRYAEYYEAYPRVVATGGDAGLLFENDALVEQIVPDLVLIGMLAACEIHAASDDAIEEE